MDRVLSDPAVTKPSGLPPETIARYRSPEYSDGYRRRYPNFENVKRSLPALRENLRTVARHQTGFGEELSSREIVVLQLAADGLTQREIADQLFISYNTVKTHLKSTYRKLGATSRHDALERFAELDVSQPVVPPV